MGRRSFEVPHTPLLQFKPQRYVRPIDVVFYYQSDVTHLLVSFFGANNSDVCFLMRRLEPLLDSLVRLEESRYLPQKETEQILNEETQPPIELPLKKQKVLLFRSKETPCSQD